MQYETFDNNIISHTKAQPMERKQHIVSYGPFSDVQPFSRAPLRLHFTNNAPFAVATTLERTLDVAWGKIGVEERYELVSFVPGSHSRCDLAAGPYVCYHLCLSNPLRIACSCFASCKPVPLELSCAPRPARCCDTATRKAVLPALRPRRACYIADALRCEAGGSVVAP